jgi:DNA polymerase
MSRVFISYRRADSEGYVGRLYDHLSQHFKPEDLFMDVDAIRPGEDFTQVLQKAVAQCDVLLAVIGPQWAAASTGEGQKRLFQWDDFVRIEIASALQRDILVIPVLVQGASMPNPAELPDDLQALALRQALHLGHRTFSADVQKLARAIHETLQERGANFARKAPANPGVIAEKEYRLKTVRDAVLNFTASPLYQHRTENRYFPVLGTGNPDAKIMFVGEAPGKTESQTGTPFVGPSGQVLDDLLASINLRRQDVYITNVLKDIPPGKEDPTAEQVAAYAPFLDQELEIIQPEVIALLGRYAIEYLLRRFEVPQSVGKIGDLRGKLIKTNATYGEIHLIPLLHPAVVLYNPSKKATLLADFQKLKLFT